MTELETKHKEIVQNYAQVCADIGDREYRMRLLKEESEQFIVKLRNLNVDAKKIEKEIYAERAAAIDAAPALVPAPENN